MSPVRVEIYAPKHKVDWDEFVRRSKNGVFLFYRDYLEYHADRFHDYSLLFLADDQLVALLPANLTGGTVVSHGGLTFGGLVTDQRMKTPLMLEVFSALTDHLRAGGIKKLIYKAIPHIYHTLPAEEDLYALFRYNASLFRRDVSSTVSKGRKIPLAKGRRHGLNRGKEQGLEVARSYEFTKFMALAEANKEARFGVRLVHTAAEIELLASRFPENIKLFTAHYHGELLGGYIIYESPNVAHAQYVGVTDDAKGFGVLDYILDILLNEIYLEKPYFDFGISTVDEGRTLNEGVIRYKESYGARATVYDFYELNLET